MIGVVDMGMGNLGSVRKALSHLGLDSRIVEEPGELSDVGRILLPGVGAMAPAAERLRERGLDTALREAVARGIPLLGICLGMQMLFGPSEEGGEGLGILEGRVRRLVAPGLKIPHVGWNAVETMPGSGLFAGIPSGSYFYFVHSYVAAPADPAVVLGRTRYGEPFPSAVGWGTVFGVQFHPEKSGTAGLQILENFGKVDVHATAAGH